MRRLPLSAQRRFMLWFYDRPSNDPYVSITMDVDLEPALEFIDAFRREHGERIGVQHLVTAAVARTLRKIPQVNVRILGRRLYALEHVNVAVPVHLDAREHRADETGIMIVRDADRLPLLELAQRTRSGARAERNGEDHAGGSALLRRLARRLPPPIVDAALSFAGSLLSRVPHDERLVVSTAVTNVGAVLKMPAGGRFRAFSATLPSKLGAVATAFAIAPSGEAPIAVGNRVLVRRVLPVAVVIDHRAVDGVLMARLCEQVVRELVEPTRLVAPLRAAA
jgi:pyruvate/2-oxoglutarate dehydrogenase complex dihydrolipoamide acyltransferase (E2) component